MGVGVALALVAVYVQFRYTYNDISKLRYRETTDVLDLRREIAVWKKAAASVSSYSKDEETVKKSLNQRAGKLSKQLKFTSTRPNELEADYRDNLRDLEIQVNTFVAFGFSVCKVWYFSTQFEIKYF